MSGFGNFLYVRTLGDPGMFMNGRKLETAFPSPEAREISLSLLSPLDECTGWETISPYEAPLTYQGNADDIQIIPR
jgi:hypothetical protein